MNIAKNYRKLFNYNALLKVSQLFFLKIIFDKQSVVSYTDVQYIVL